MGMQVRFWGTRGSIPTPGRDTVVYGGNTACVEVRCGETLLVFDAGTGIRECGLNLVTEKKHKETHLLLSHTHWDHIQGFPFFVPAFIPGHTITVYGPRLAGTEQERTISQALNGQLEYSYFPIRAMSLGSTLQFREHYPNETFAINDVTIATHKVNHPVLALAYRVTWGGRTLVYATDSEPYDPDFYRAQGLSDFETIAAMMTGQHRAFVANADLLIHDAQYTAAEYRQRMSWGHSTDDYVFALARDTGVKEALFFHHDPQRTDAHLAEIERNASARAQAAGFRCRAAAEGLTLEL